MNIAKIPLSGSTDGRPIKVAATSDPGTTIHTAQSGTTGVDEIWLYANNTSGSDVTLTIEWGSNSSPDDLIIQTIPHQAGLMLIVPGFLLRNSLVAKAYAGTANVVNITGFVNSITT